MVTVRHATLTSELGGQKIGATEWDEAHEVSGLTASDVSGLATVATSGSAADLSGTLAAARLPAFTGDITTPAGSAATTLATVNSNVGSFGSSTAIPVITLNGKGLATAASTTAISINGANWSGQDLAVADGGTGASSASAARTNLGLEIGADVQAHDATLDALSGLSIGASSDTDILDRQSADGRYALSGSGIADGDKGDITVSSSGAVWTVDNDAITYAKMQNVSATDKLLGRSTAGSGDVEEIACTAAGRALLDDVDAAAQRTTLGLGTAATQNTGTSGANIPLLNAVNTFSTRTDFNGTIRATSVSNFTAGVGAEMYWTGTNAVWIGFNRGTGVYVPLYFEGSTLTFNVSGAGSAFASSSTGVITFPLTGTTASAANAFLDSGASNAMKRSTSSAHYKTNIEDVEQAYLDAILAVRPVYYKSNPATAPGDNPSHGHWGYISEEVAAADPRCVHYGYWPEDYETVYEDEEYQRDTGRKVNGQSVMEKAFRKIGKLVLRKGAQLKPDGAQYERIHVLKIEALKRQVQALEARLAALEAA